MPIILDGTLGATFPAGGLGNPAGAVVGTTDAQTLTNKTVVFGSTQFATVVGTAPMFACRAWVNFNGQGTVAIRASGNVSSITDNGVGDYTVNFTTAMPDANYSMVVGGGNGRTLGSGVVFGGFSTSAPTTTAARFTTYQQTPTLHDPSDVCVTVFR